MYAVPTGFGAGTMDPPTNVPQVQSNMGLPQTIDEMAPRSSDQRQTPQLVRANQEINALIDLYQQQLVELNAAHSLLLEDQEHLATQLAPFVDSAGRTFTQVDDDVLLMKHGLDLRLVEFEEDCRRIKQTEKRLQRKLDELALGYDAMVMEAQGFAESRLVSQVKDLQKIIGLLYFEVDELRFQRDIYADEAKRLRGVCRYGNWVEDGLVGDVSTPCTPRTLHHACSAAPAQLYSRKHEGAESETVHLGRRVSDTRRAMQKPTSPWGGIFSHWFGAHQAKSADAKRQQEKFAEKERASSALSLRRKAVRTTQKSKSVTRTISPRMRQSTAEADDSHDQQKPLVERNDANAIGPIMPYPQSRRRSRDIKELTASEATVPTEMIPAEDQICDRSERFPLMLSRIEAPEANEYDGETSKMASVGGLRKRSDSLQRSVESTSHDHVLHRHISRTLASPVCEVGTTVVSPRAPEVMSRQASMAFLGSVMIKPTELSPRRYSGNQRSPSLSRIPSDLSTSPAHLRRLQSPRIFSARESRMYSVDSDANRVPRQSSFSAKRFVSPLDLSAIQ